MFYKGWCVVLAAAAVPGGATTAFAQAVPAPVASSPYKPAIAAPTAEARTLGFELAKFINNEDLTRAQAAKASKVSLPKVLREDPNYTVLEKAYPGITDAVLAVAGPEIERSAVEQLPVMWKGLGEVFADNLTAAELQELVAFYRSPTGAWVLQSVAEGTDLTDLMRQQVAEPESAVTAKQLNDSITAPGIARVLKTATPERTRDLVRFGMSPLGAKMRRLNPILASTAARLTNESKPEDQARVAKAVEDAMRDFIAKSDAARNGPHT